MVDYSRTFFDDGFRRRAACVCVRNEEEKEVLLVSSRKNENWWIIPGGGINLNEEPAVAATREVKEEAGVIGKLDRFLGIFENTKSCYRTFVYVLIVTEELSEWEDLKRIGRKRKWFHIKEAMEIIYKSHEKDYLKQLINSQNKL
ncbi:diphosphoinositol polyphosphate phosphohydrolase 1-like [Centruroides sculpturatus]|uniref:diphosphoinositol polyphosphate phosphohydrolase 1-like n=1 Tax=Centruroides sculpturatus TaxID=218467 RepID=UPI000C6CE3D3|nr:diphosphoinositol polyphosphate phosphohydrolase 1-like [Centruroides sculpturatus]